MKSSAQLTGVERLCLVSLFLQLLKALALHSAREIFDLSISRGRSNGEF